MLDAFNGARPRVRSNGDDSNGDARQRLRARFGMSPDPAQNPRFRPGARPTSLPPTPRTPSTSPFVRATLPSTRAPSLPGRVPSVPSTPRSFVGRPVSPRFVSPTQSPMSLSTSSTQPMSISPASSTPRSRDTVFGAPEGPMRLEPDISPSPPVRSRPVVPQPRSPSPTTPRPAVSQPGTETPVPSSVEDSEEPVLATLHPEADRPREFLAWQYVRSRLAGIKIFCIHLPYLSI